MVSLSNPTDGPLTDWSQNTPLRYKLQPELKKAVKVLSEFALKLVDAIARTAELLKNQPKCCAMCMPAGGCCGGS